jgi:orotate phosphoribosyltransferase
MSSYVLELTDPSQLRSVDAGDFANREITPEEFDHMLRLVDGLWLHSGDMSAPHAELTSGKCSNGFVDTLRLLKYTNISMFLAEELANLYTRSGYDLPDWVVGSDHAGAVFSAFLAHCLDGAKHEFTEKSPDGKAQLWKRHTIGVDEQVLQCEELVTTTATLERVRTGVSNGNAHPVTFLPVSMTLIHRSPTYEFGDGPIIFFRHYDIEVWNPEDCPLCSAGSPRLRPKQHWVELTAV